MRADDVTIENFLMIAAQVESQQDKIRLNSKAGDHILAESSIEQPIEVSVVVHYLDRESLQRRSVTRSLTPLR